MTAREGRVAPEVALGIAAGAEDDLAGRPSLHDLEAAHDHDDFESFVVAGGPVTDGVTFRDRLLAVIRANDVLRVKGFAAVANKPLRLLVQAVGARVTHQFDRPWNKSERREGRLVVIGLKGLDRAAITDALRA